MINHGSRNSELQLQACLSAALARPADSSTGTKPLEFFNPTLTRRIYIHSEFEKQARERERERSAILAQAILAQGAYSDFEDGLHASSKGGCGGGEGPDCASGPPVPPKSSFKSLTNSAALGESNTREGPVGRNTAVTVT